MPNDVWLTSRWRQGWWTGWGRSESGRGRRGARSRYRRVGVVAIVHRCDSLSLAARGVGCPVAAEEALEPILAVTVRVAVALAQATLSLLAVAIRDRA